jgi:DNA-3-methyladenine glycosylase II
MRLAGRVGAALRRPDAWPTGDLALALAAQRAKRRPTLPGTLELERLGAAWRPWRAVAARILWHD